jgi:predicted metalloprotease with PDZ domain/PhoPQ-activated pathogenicity-related protein
MAKSGRWFIGRALLAVLLSGLLHATCGQRAHAGLDDYVKKPDGAFAWVLAGKLDTPAGTIISVKLTSQVWQGITWKHDLTVYEPREIAFPDAMLLFITGGDNQSTPGDDDHKRGFGLAQLCGARVAVLRQVPNQPLLGGKSEDELIAETFVRYLETKNEDWPLLFPMVKSAVRAMDALQAWAKEHGRPAVSQFVVAGGSKRGWTTWLTGAVDDRVKAIAPMVIVMLNLGKQGPNQLEVWGAYSEQIHDYVERGLMEKVETPTGTNLWRMVDPFTYRDRLTKPKLLINGTNDRYWTQNALDFYWADLKGPKYLLEVPNAGHGLEVNRDWALSSLGAFFHAVVTDRTLPRLSWDRARGADGDSTLTIHASPPPKTARIWTATSPTRDFRESRWEPSPLAPGETMTRHVPPPASGHVAYFGELEYQLDGVPYHLTTTLQEPAVPPAAATVPVKQPIIYTVKAPTPDKHTLDISAEIPTGKAAAVDLMMPVWSPGYYRVQDYAKQVENLAARTPGGTALQIDHPEKNRWRVQTAGESKLVISYQLTCRQTSVTTNYVGEDLAVLNPAAAFLTLVESKARPHEIRLELAPKWKKSVTALKPAPDGQPNHYRADDYETLVDSPIVAGEPVIHEFEVDGSKHYLVDIGDLGTWDGVKAAGEIKQIVAETRRFWGFLPFKTYYFLNVFRRGGGGLEHKNSTLLTATPVRTATPGANFRWLGFVSHEYFHAFNVKRLRPVELGPFDFEHPPRTSGLWIAEGLTSYCGELIVVRAGLGTTLDYLAALSRYIDRVQNSPGRLVQSLEQASLDVWNSGFSGVGRNATKTISYYDKGPVVGFLLDARIRRMTGDKKSLDDVMRLAYKRYAGERGFTADEFRATASEVAGADLKEWFAHAISSTRELDYAEALDWFGLQFAAVSEPAEKDDTTKGGDSPKQEEPAKKAEPPKPDEPAKKDAPTKKWKLEIRADATPSQKAHLDSFLHRAPGP